MKSLQHVTPALALLRRRWFLLTGLSFVVVCLQMLAPSTASAQSAYYRLQLKNNSQFLDAKYCGQEITLNPGSDYEAGACQLWRLVPTGDGWNRLQLKHGGAYLDAAYCGDTMSLNPGSSYEGGACQLWRFVPVGGGWGRLQLKHGMRFLDADHCGTRITLNPGSDYDGGSCQLWRLVPPAGRRID